MAATVQSVLFYMYTEDLPALRERLLKTGLQPGPISHPEHLPSGELFITDPDGYPIGIAHWGRAEHDQWLERVGKTTAITTVGAFLNFSRWKLLDEYWPRLRGCVESLTDEQVWWRPNDQSNSIGNLMLHLNGNVRQWLVAAFSDQEDDRNRPAEFAQRDAIARDELLQTLGTTMDQAGETLARLGEADLLRRMNIQGYKVNGLQAVYQVVEHFGLHYGQITYITKLLTGQDLGFYKELDATGRR